MTAKQKHFFHFFLFVLLAAFWGGSFVAIKIALKSIEPSFAASLRLLVAFVALYFVFLLQKKKLSLSKAFRGRVWMLGVLSIALPFGLLFWGEQSVAPGIAGILNGSVPIWTSLILFFFIRTQDKEDIHLKSVFGIVLGFAGILLVFFPILQKSLEAELLGALAIVAMAVCYALGNILNRIILTNGKGISVSAAVFHQHLASVISLFIFSYIVVGSPDWAGFLKDRDAVYAIIYLGVCSTALALSIYFYLLKEWGSVKVSSVAYLIPVFAILFDWMIFSNTPGLYGFLGISLIFIGVFFIRTSRSAGKGFPDQKST